MGVEIYVGHISGSVTEDEVRKLFSVAGTVTSVHLVKDLGTGQYRGCGYVRMSTEDEARELIDLLNGAMLGVRWPRLVRQPEGFISNVSYLL